MAQHQLLKQQCSTSSTSSNLRAARASAALRPAVHSWTSTRHPRPDLVARVSHAPTLHFRDENPMFQQIAEATTIKPTKGSRPPGDKHRAVLSWAGAGIFFFWQLGAMKYLAQHYDLTKSHMAGASGGALAAIFAACGVSADKVVDRAYELSNEYKIWDKTGRFGQMGVWGPLLERWLDDLLPADAAERCRGRINIIVTTLPKMNQVGISDFKDKADLINIMMASAHVPMFLDYKFTRKCRGMRCLDGSLPDFFYNGNSELLKCEGSAVIFDYFDDINLKRSGRMDMLELKSYEEIMTIMECGFQFAKKLREEGKLSHLNLVDLNVEAITGSQDGVPADGSSSGQKHHHHHHRRHHHTNQQQMQEHAGAH